MSFSCKKSFNNSSFSKADKKAVEAIDASAKGDFGVAYANVSWASGSTRVVHKEIHRAPSDSLRTPDKAILKVDESKLVVKKDDDLGFAVKAPSCPNAPLKAPKKAKQNLAAEFFAHASCSATAILPRAAEPAPQVAPREQEQPSSRWAFSRK